jgi:hypothetical protein
MRQRSTPHINQQHYTLKDRQIHLQLDFGDNLSLWDEQTTNNRYATGRKKHQQTQIKAKSMQHTHTHNTQRVCIEYITQQPSNHSLNNNKVANKTKTTAELGQHQHTGDVTRSRRREISSTYPS